jgi:hypothetical protein
MTTTPLWVPLVIAGLGVLGTVLGSVITQRRADHRETLQWDRTRTREREQWAREDVLRTFEQRSSCYMEFEEQIRSTALAVYEAQSGVNSMLDEDWQNSAFQSLLRLQVFAPPDTTAASLSVYDALLRWGEASRENSYHMEAFYDRAHDQYLAAIRRDLGITIHETDMDQSK